jgi:hypothetical protein
MNKQYKILSAFSQEELSNKVNVLMDYGWSPEGGMTIDESKTDRYTQTMIRMVESIKVENSSDNGKQLLHG